MPLYGRFERFVEEHWLLGQKWCNILKIFHIHEHTIAGGVARQTSLLCFLPCTCLALLLPVAVRSLGVSRQLFLRHLKKEKYWQVGYIIIEEVNLQNDKCYLEPKGDFGTSQSD